MGYTKQTWSTGDTITAAKMNHIEEGIDLSDYDLIIENTYYYGDNANMSPSDFVIVKGNILDLEEKIDNGEVVKGLCILHSDWSTKPSWANTRIITKYLPLTYFNGPYKHIVFGATFQVYGGGSNQTIFFATASFAYNEVDGTITAAGISTRSIA